MSSSRHHRGLACLKAAIYLLAALQTMQRVTAQTAPTNSLTELRLDIVGVRLAVDPPTLTVPKNIPTQINTKLVLPDGSGAIGSTAQASFLSDTSVQAELRGPSLTPRTITVLPGQPIPLPPFALTGAYVLDHIRLVKNGQTILDATPNSVPITVIGDILLASVSSRPLSLAEIQAMGIVIDQNNFQVLNFTLAFTVQGKPVNINLPVALPGKGIGLTSDQLGAIKLQLPTLNALLAKTVKLPPELDLPGFNFSIAALPFMPVDDDGENDLGFSPPPVVGLVVIPGNVAYLDQFFSVLLMVTNTAPNGTPLTLRDVTGQISLPLGPSGVPGNDAPLQLAQTASGANATVKVVQVGPDGQLGTADDIPLIPPQQTGDGEFLVEGRHEGSYDVNIAINAVLDGLPSGPVRLSGQATGAVLVRNPKFSLTLSQPSTVNTGEQYDLYATVTNTSQTPANLVSINLDPRSISGAQLISNPTVTFNTIPPGSSGTAKFTLTAQQTGSVTYTWFTSDDGLSGAFQLRTGVGERGITLSPNSIVLPSTVSQLPASLVAAAQRVLGQALSVANDPVLPPDVLFIKRETVTTRGVELAEAGQRVQFGEPLSRVLQDLLLDWLGNRTADDGFDQLLRSTDAGQSLMQVFATLIEGDVATKGVLDYQQQFAQLAAGRAPQVMVITGSGASPAPVELSIADASGLTVSDQDSSVVRDLPYASLLNLLNGQEQSDLAVLAQVSSTRYIVTVHGTGSGQFDLGIVIPAGQGQAIQLRYSGVSIQKGGVAQVIIDLSNPSNYSLTLDSDGDGVTDQTIAPTQVNISEEAPQVVAVRQLARLNENVLPIEDYAVHGLIIAALFNKPMDNASVENPSNYSVDANQVSSIALQPSGRLAYILLNKGVGTFIQRNMSFSNLADEHGNTLAPFAGPINTVLSDGGIVVGRVITAQGQPVANAQLTLQVCCGPDGPVGISQFNVGDDGSFQFDYVFREQDDTGSIQLTAINPTTSERASRFARVSVSGQKLLVNLQFIGNGTVRGHIYGPDGITPAPGATVLLQPNPTSSLSSSQTHQVAATSNALGEYVMTSIPVGPYIVQSANTEGYGDASGVLNTAGDVAVTDVVLATPKDHIGKLQGRVFKSDGVTPAANFQVYVGSKTTDPTEFSAVAQATTDASGSFSFESLRESTYDVIAIDPATQQLGRGSAGVVALRTSYVAIVMQSTGSVQGIVRNAQDQPVSGALIAGGTTLGVTDANGLFTIDGVPAGPATISAGDPVTHRQGSANVTVLPGQTVQVVITLEARASITGRVLDANGQPVPRASVRIPRDGGFFFVIANNQGVYKVPDVQLDEYLLEAPGPAESDLIAFMQNVGIPVSSAYTAGDAPADANPPPVNPNDADAVLQAYQQAVQIYVGATNPLLVGFKPVSDAGFGWNKVKLLQDSVTVNADIRYLQEGTASGTTVTSSGTPIGASVRLVTLGVDQAGNPVVKEKGRINSDPATGAFQFSGITRFDLATFQATQIRAGDFTLQAASPFSPAIPTFSGQLNPDTLNMSGIVLQFPASTDTNGTISGTVVMPDGVTPAPAGTQVHISFGDLTVTTDAQGKFKDLLPIPKGGYSVTAVEPISGFQGQAIASVPAGGNVDVLVRLLGLGSVGVTVKHPDGSLVPGAKINFQRGGFPGLQLNAVSNDGTAKFTNIPEGPFSVNGVELGTGLSGMASGTVKQDQETDVVITIGPSGQVIGKFVRVDGITPAPNAQISLAEGALTAYAVTDDAGKFQLTSIPVGKFSVSAIDAVTGRQGYASGEIRFDGDVASVTLVELPRGNVSGVVLQSNGIDRVGGALVTCDSVQLTAHDDGSFLCEGVAIGSVSLTAMDPISKFTGQATGTLSYEGQTDQQNILLDPYGTVRVTVLNPDGTPAQNATVSIPDPTVDPNHPRVGTVDTNGLVVFNYLRLGTYNVVAQSLATDAQHSGGTSTATLKNAGDTVDTTIQLRGVGTVTATVVASDGITVVPGAQVTLSASAALPNETRTPFGALFTAFTDSTGVAQFVGVPVGTFFVSAQINRVAGLSTGVISVPGQSIPIMVQMAPSGTIRGRVLLPGGKIPAAQTYVTLNFQPGNSLQSGKLQITTDLTGTFSFTGIPLGAFQISAFEVVSSGVITVKNTLSSDGQVLDLGDLVLDNTSPSIIGITPATGAMGVPATTAISISFDKPVQNINPTPPPSPLNPNPSPNVALYQGSTLIDTTLSLSNGGQTITLTPKSPLTSATQYTVIVKGAPDGPQDQNGLELLEPFVSAFIVQDTTPPIIVSESPANNATAVTPDSVVRVSFSKTVAPGFSLVANRDDGTPVSGILSTAFGGTVVIFTPTNYLSPNATFVVTLSNVVDLAGNSLSAGPVAFRFSTIDTIAPTISSLSVVGSPSEIAGTQVIVQPAIADTDVARVEYQIANGTSSQVVSSSPFSKTISLPTNLASIDIVATAVDTSGNRSAPVTLVVPIKPNQPPTVSLSNTSGTSAPAPGQTVHFAVTATDDVAVSKVIISSTGIFSTNSELDVPSGQSSFSADFDLQVPANAGAGNVTVRAASIDSVGNQSSPSVVSLQVTVVPPSIISVAPSSGTQGQTEDVTINAVNTHFTNATSFDFGAGVTVNSVQATSSTSAIVNITVSPIASIGARVISAQTNAETETGSGLFTLVLGPAAIASITPAQGHQSDHDLLVAITGSNTHFTDATPTVNLGTGVVVSGLQVLTDTSLTVRLQIDPLAPVQSDDVLVVTGGETARLASGFVVLTSAPRTVVGTDITTYIGADGTQTKVPVDLSSQSIQALVSDGRGGYTVFSGAGASDGTFSIPNVPVGSYLLRYGNSYLATTASNIDLGHTQYGRANVQYPSQPTTATFDLSGGGSTPIVLPSNTQWSAIDDAGTAVITANNPRSGNGSLELTRTGAGTVAYLRDGITLGTIGNLSSLGFDWYVDPSSNQASSPEIAIRIYPYGDPRSFFLFWNSCCSAPTGAWQHSDVFSQLSIQGADGNPPPASLSEVPPEAPVVGIHLRAAFANNSNWHGYADNVSIGFNGIVRSFNFEASGTSYDLPLLVSTEAGVYSYLNADNLPSSVTTTWNQGLLDASQGDVTYITQQAINSRLGYNFGVTSYSSGPLSLTILDGGNPDFKVTLGPTPQDQSVRFNVQGSILGQIRSLVSATPSSQSTSMGIESGPVYANSLPDLLTVSGPALSTDTDFGDVAYSNLFPTGSRTTAYLFDTTDVQFQLAGTSNPVHANGLMIRRFAPLPTSTNPLALTVGPVGSPQVDGTDFFTNQSTGFTPTISWTTPSFGTANGYIVSIRNLSASGMTTTLLPVATFTTTSTSLTVPAGTLNPGQEYVFFIEAINSQNDFNLAPNQYFGSDYGRADAVSAVITVGGPPFIQQQPADQTVLVGNGATFAVIATGTGPISYQWLRNGVVIPGATSASYTTPPLTSGDNGETFAVQLTNAGGTVTSRNATLMVNSVLPATIKSVSPTSGAQGQTLNVTVFGQSTSFDYSTVFSLGNDVVINSVTINSSTSATVNVTIPPTANTGFRNVVASTGNQVATGTNLFSVNGGLAHLTAVTPNSGRQNQDGLVITITGNNTHFTLATPSVNLGPGVLVSNASVTSDTVIAVTVNISATAPVENNDVVVTTGGEVATLVNGFQVLAGLPAVSSISPTGAHQNDSNVNINVLGYNTHFVQGTTLASLGAGITINSVTVNSLTSASVNISVQPNAATGNRDLTITTGAEVVTLGQAFAVLAGLPQIASVTPTMGAQGSTQTLTINGLYTDWQTSVSQLSFSGSGITVGTVTVNGPTQIQVPITVTVGANAGARTVYVTTGSDQESWGPPNNTGFTVQPGQPAVEVISPNVAQANTVVTVSITGQFTNFTSGVTQASFGSGISVNGGTLGGFGNLTVHNSTYATASLSISSSAACGARTITIQTVNGSINEVLTVNNGFTVCSTAAQWVQFAPFNGEINVPTNAAIQWQNSVPLDRSTLNANDFLITPISSGGCVTSGIPGTVSLDASGRVVTLLPSTVLSVNTGYYVCSNSPGRSSTQTVNSGADALITSPAIGDGYATTDKFTLASANTIQRISFSSWANSGGVPHTVDWAITTGPNSGTTIASGTASQLTSVYRTSVRNNTTDVYQVSFPVNVQLAAGTYWLLLQNGYDQSGADLGWGVVSTSGNGEQFLNGAFRTNVGTMSFQVSGPTYLTDTAGNQLAYGSTSFTTGFGPDNSGPAFTVSNLVPNDTGVPLNAPVVLAFSKPLNFITVPNAITVSNGGQPVAGTFSHDNTYTQITFTPSSNWVANTIYTVSYTNALLDTVGNALTNAGGFNFTTGSATDTTGPQWQNANPASGETTGTQPTFEITYNEPLDPVYVDPADVFLYTNQLGTRARVPLSLSLSPDRKTLIATLTSPLQPGTTYVFEACDAYDRVGNGACNSWSFTTAGSVDTTQPTVQSVSPPNGAIGVQVNAILQALMTEQIDRTVAPIMVLTNQSASATVATTYGLATDNETLTFTPTTLLAPNTTYQAMLSGARDVDGNVMLPYSWTFSTNSSATADTTTGTITITPVSGATNVATNATITFALSKVVNPASVNSSSIVVFDNTSAGNFMDGTIVLSANGQAITFTPSSTAPFAANRQYCAYGSYSGGLKDLTGRTFNAAESCFTTANTPDTTVPTVSIVPSNGATGIGTNATITLTFSKPMNQNSVSSAIAVYNGDALYASGGNFSRSSDWRVWTYSGNLPYSSTFTVVVDPSASDSSGNQLGSEFQSSFTTMSQPVVSGPSVTAYRPGAGATGVDPNATITLFVSEPLNPATVQNAFYVSQNGVLITGAINVTENNQVITFKPSVPFQKGALIQWSLTSGATDTFGNPAGGTTVSFTVAPDLTSTAPIIVTQVPPGYSSGVPTNSYFEVVFSKPIDQSTVSSATFYLLNPSNQNVQGAITQPLPNVLRLTPNSLLSPSGCYAYVLHATNGLKDTSGLAYSGNSWGYCIAAGPDNTVPVVTSIVPTQSASNIGTNALLRVSFNKVIDTSLITSASMPLTTGGIPIPYTYTVSNGNNGAQMITVTPEAPLPASSSISLSIANGITDRVGNPVTPASSEFQTAAAGPNFSSPQIIASNIANGDTSVPITSVFKFTFDRPMDATTLAMNSTVYLRDNFVNQYLPINFSLDATGTMLTVAPQSMLAANRSYYVEICSVLDLTGNFSACSTYSFTTALYQPTSGPRVLTTNPPNNWNGFPVNGYPEVLFDRTVSEVSAKANITLTQNGASVPVTLTFASGDTLVTVVPSVPLLPGLPYALNITSVTDSAGTPSASTFVNFTTGSGTVRIAPTVVSSTPPNGTTIQGTNPIIQWVFNEPLDPVRSGMNASIETNVPSAGWVYLHPVSVTLSADLKTLTMSYPGPLPASSQMEADAYTVYDMAGNSTSTYTGFYTGSAPDSAGPQVISYTPSNGATVPTNVVIKAVLNEALDPDSWNPSVITLIGVAGIVTHDSSNTVITFAPSAPLTPTSHYTFTIPGSAFTDVSGNPMQPFSLNFTTGTGVQAGNGTILMSNPAPGSINVPTNSTITLALSRAVDPTTVNDTAFTITDNNGRRVAGGIAIGSSGTSLVFTPDGPLAPAMQYHVYAGYYASLYDQTGAVFSYLYNTTFTTLNTADTVVPTVVSITPTGGNVGPHAPITIVFSEAMNPSFLNSSYITLYNGYTQLSAAISVSSDNTSVTLTGTWPFNSTLTVNVSSQIPDLEGNTLLAEVQTTFSTITQPSGAVSSPSITAYRPGSGATGVAANSSITLYSNAPVTAATLGSGLAVVQNGVLYSGTAVVMNDGQTVVWTPSLPFSPGATVQLFVTPSATDIYYRPFSSLSYAFTIAPDLTNTAPTLVNTYPGCCGGSPTNSFVEAAFSKAINPITVNSSTFYLINYNNQLVTGTISQPFPNVLRFTPSAALTASLCYFGFLHVTSGLQDTNGLAFSGTNVGICTGASADNTPPPSVASIIPYDGATNIGNNATIVITFSKIVDTNTINSQTVSLMNGSTAVPFTMSFSTTNSGNQTVARITPQAALPNNVDITVSLSSGITDGVGQPIATKTATFHTMNGADFSAPRVVNYTLQNVSTSYQLPVNSTFTFTFNTPLDPTSVTQNGSSGNIYFQQYDTATGYTYPAVKITLSPDGTTVTLTPASNLTPGDRYDICADAYDLSGNGPGGVCAGYYFASSVTDTTPPQVTVTMPQPNATAVPVNTLIEVAFNEALSAESLDHATLTANGNTVQVAASLQWSDTTVRLTPNALLHPNTTYTVTMAGVADIAGNTIAPYSFTFTTGANALNNTTVFNYQATTASVGGMQTQLISGQNINNVDTTSSFRVSFTQPVETASLVNNGVYLRTYSSNVAVPLVVTMSADGKSATATPQQALTPSTEYILYVSYSSGTIYDEVGNAVSGGTYYYITTGSGPTTPNITTNFYPASDYSANTSSMDSLLGVTGYTITDFETTTLPSGLSISLSGGVNSATWTSLPTLFSDSACGSLSIGAWDGTHAAINTTTNALDNCSNPSNIASLITFTYSPGTTSFGISLSNFQSTNPPSPQFPVTNHELFVNGVDLGQVEVLAGSTWSPGVVRNAYLRIDAHNGTSITSVAFQNLSAADVLEFDHLAIK